MENTEENNKLIAEFMNVDQVDIDTWIDTEGELKYHKSWDWLMPVINKIRNTTSRDKDIFSTNVILNGYKVIIESGSYEPKPHSDRFYNRTFSGAGKDEMETTIKAVVDYIKWYNSNKI